MSGNVFDIFNDQFLSDFAGLGAAAKILPSTDVQETKDNFIIKMDAPGFSKDQIEIDCEGNTLTLKGNYKQDTAPQEEIIRDYVRERAEESFMRSVTLPSAIQADKVSAKMSNGVLCVVIPKSEEAKQKRIAIQ